MKTPQPMKFVVDFKYLTVLSNFPIQLAKYFFELLDVVSAFFYRQNGWFFSFSI